MTARSTVPVALRVNGEKVSLECETRTTLADGLRDDLGLTGTHLGCEHGVCGACTVLLDGEPVRSCLVLAAQCDGHDVRTVEGLAVMGSQDLHPLQSAFADCHGLQCGFCTPGFLMLLAGVLEERPDIDDDELREVVSSNLCRCTGYDGILAAARQARSTAATWERPPVVPVTPAVRPSPSVRPSPALRATTTTSAATAEDPPGDRRGGAAAAPPLLRRAAPVGLLAAGIAAAVVGIAVRRARLRSRRGVS